MTTDKTQLTDAQLQALDQEAQELESLFNEASAIMDKEIYQDDQAKSDNEPIPTCEFDNEDSAAIAQDWTPEDEERLETLTASLEDNQAKYRQTVEDALSKYQLL